MSSDGAFAAAAGDRGGGGRRGCGNSPAPATKRPDRARPGRRPTVLHGLSARPSGGFSQPPAPSRARRAGRGLRHARRCSPGARRGGCSTGSSARPLLGGAAAGAGISLLLVVTDLPLRAWMRERALDVGLATQSWPDWAVDVAKSAGIGAASRRHRRSRCCGARAAVPAQLVGAGRRAGDRVRRRDDLALPDPDRPALQRLREAAAGPAPQRRDRAGGRGPAWTWGRSTAWTRAAGPRPRTPT